MAVSSESLSVIIYHRRTSMAIVIPLGLSLFRKYNLVD